MGFGLTSLIGFGAGGERPPFAYRTKGTSAVATIAVPAAAEAGDFALLFDYARQSGSTNPTTVVPSGFSSINNVVGTGTFRSRGIVSGKVLTAGDLGATLTGMAGDTALDKLLLIFSGGWGSFGTGSLNGVVDDNNPAAQSVTATGGAAPLIVFGVSAYNTDFGAFSTASPAFDATQQGAGRVLGGYKLYAASPADHSIDMNDLGSGNWLASGYITLT